MLTIFAIELSPSELATIRALHETPSQDDSDWEMTDEVFIDVLNGNQPLNISHEGGEFGALEDLARQVRKE